MSEIKLPTDIESLHLMIAKLQSQVDEQAFELSLKNNFVEEQAHSVLQLKENSDLLDKKVTELNLTIEKLLNQLYGRRSERRIDGAGQLLLDLGEEATPEVVSALEEAIREAEKIVEEAENARKNRKRKPPKRGDRKFPAHIPRYERIIDLPEDKREGLKFIGYDEVETLEQVRAELRVREQDLFAGRCWVPSRSTLSNIEAAVEFALRPLDDACRSFMKQDRTIGCDDTGVLLIAPKAIPDLSDHPRRERIVEVLEQAIADGKPSINAHMWGYYPSQLPVVAFDFTVSRHRDGPDNVLGDYTGNLLGDCWSGFQKIEIRSDSRITFAACWAHARRKVDECRGAFPNQVAKLESLIRMLYDVEDQIRSLPEAERLERRGSLSRHTLSLIDQYLNSDEMSPHYVLPKSNLGMAAAYIRRNWESLNRFVEDSSIPIDNNDCEQLMKRVATGRKN